MEFDTTIDFSKLARGDSSETLKFAVMMEAMRQAEAGNVSLGDEEGAE